MPDVRLPKIGMDMTDARVVKWLVTVGDPVRKGDPLVEVESDKVTVVLEATESGVLQEIVVHEESVALPGDVLAMIAPAAGAQENSRGSQKTDER